MAAAGFKAEKASRNVSYQHEGNLVQGHGVTEVPNGVPSKLVLRKVHDGQESKLHTH
jgi:hypothetical protein